MVAKVQGTSKLAAATAARTAATVRITVPVSVAVGDYEAFGVLAGSCKLSETATTSNTQHHEPRVSVLVSCISIMY